MADVFFTIVQKLKKKKKDDCKVCAIKRSNNRIIMGNKTRWAKKKEDIKKRKEMDGGKVKE